MSAMMAGQRSRVQLEQSDMPLAMNMAKIAKEGFPCAAIEETQYLINKPCTEVREEKQRDVEFPWHKKVNAAMERHPAMLRQNHPPGCLFCQNCTANNLQTRWRHKGTGTSTPNRRRQQTPEPTLEPTPHTTPPLPGTLPTSTGINSGAQSLKIINLPATYAYSRISLSCTESFTLDISARDSEHNTDFDPDLSPDVGTSTGWYTIGGVVMQLSSILKTRAAN